MSSTCDVAIVGAGIGGLTLAASLTRRSVPVRVFEQDTELREIGAGIAIAGNATRVLRQLDIDLTSVAHEPEAFEVHSWRDGSLIWSHPIGRWYREEMGSPLLTLHRATLQRHLASAVPPEAIRLDHQLVRLTEEADGVRLHFGNGADALARIVVAADGIASVARRYVRGDIRPRQSGEIGFRGIIPIARTRDLPSPGSLHCWCGPGTHAIYYGVDGFDGFDGGTINLLIVYVPDRLPDWAAYANRTEGTPEEAAKIFAGYSWDQRIIDLVRDIEGDASFWALADLPRLSGWSRGRVVLLGDAAHAPLPHQGQGAGQAIEDAHVLGSLLAEDNDWARVFADFENLRRRRAWRVQAYSRAAGRAYKFTGAAAERRDATWATLPERIGWIHRCI